MEEGLTPGAAPWRPSLGAWLEDAAVRFRVWAPRRRQVRVRIETAGRESVHALESETDGTFSGLVQGLGPGDLYRYELDDDGAYPDPASRFQPHGVHGPSQVIDPRAFAWSDAAWRGRRLDELVLYELHVGTFTSGGTFAAAAARLPYLAELGVTALELMPLADFPGSRNWGYDGAALFAPARCYGSPDDLRRLVDAAHGLGLAVVVDVVYNHFGPDGAYAGVFSPDYFSGRHQTAWGAAINLDGEHGPMVRRFFVENALHWAHEYHVDGLRLDATHALVDESPRPFLAELAEELSRGVTGRKVLVIAEDHRNLAQMLRPSDQGQSASRIHFAEREGGSGGAAAVLTSNWPRERDSLPTRARGFKGVRRSTPLLNRTRAQRDSLAQASGGSRGVRRSTPLLNDDGWGLDAVWADDFHHQVRRGLAGDREGYFRDFTGSVEDLSTTLRLGWFFRGQHSEHHGGPRGSDPEGLAPRQFVICIQNHDQVGNRAFGERLHQQIEPAAYRAATALLLCAPETPLLFMGQEWAASSPFLFFTDHNTELGRQVTEGRRREFKAFAAFGDRATREGIPDPQATETFLRSRLQWTEAEREPHAAVGRLYRALLELRRREPLLRPNSWDGFEAVPCGQAALVLARTAPELGSLVIAVQWIGAVRIDLGSAALEHVPAAAEWRVVLSTEEARFSADPLPARIEAPAATRPLLRFERPGAVILKTGGAGR